MVLHDLNQACRYADHVIAMRDGRLHAAGPPGEIVDAQLVQDVFGVAARVIDDPESHTPLCLPVATRTRAVPAHAPADGFETGSSRWPGDRIRPT